MVVQNEKRLLWHPRRENRFIVGGGSQITLYDWALESSEIKQVTTQLDLNLMKCFTWSPDPILTDLVAVGLSTGKVDLIRLEATKFSRNQVLPSGLSNSLPASRNSRACNALAFSSVEPNYLAVGLDKVRGDPSLIIWDIHTLKPSRTLDTSAAVGPAVSQRARSTSQARIPRADFSTKINENILQQHAPAEMVSAVAFLPASPTSLLAGLSPRWLRLYDLRSATASPPGVACKVNGIATDSFEPHRFACYGEGIATIWDARRLTQPLLTFTEKDAGADGARTKAGAVYSAIEFSMTRRGMLATLEKDSAHVRFWDLQQAEAVEAITPERTRSRDSSQSGRVTRSWTNPSSMLPWTGSTSSAAGTHSPAPVPAEPALPYNLVLSDTRKTKRFNRQLVSFALVPSARTHPLTSDIMVVTKEGDLELYAMHDIPKPIPWSARGDLTIGLGRSYRTFPGIRELSPPPDPWDIPITPSIPPSKAQSLDRHAGREESVVRGRTGKMNRSPAPLFGRGDEDGFPALPAKAPTNLAATRPGRIRTYSPAALRKLKPDGASITQDTQLSEATLLPVDDANAAKPNEGYPKKYQLGHHSRHASLLRRLPLEKTAQHLVEEDVSMTMRRRVIKGYGLTSPLHNATVVADTSHDGSTLASLWRWIHHSQLLLATPTSRLEGYNFAYQGLSGIWEGFRPQPQAPTSTHTTPRMVKRSMLLNTPVAALTALPDIHSNPSSRHSSRRRGHPAGGVPEDFLSAIHELNERNGHDLQGWKPAISATAKLAQRQLALQLCGWSLAEDDLERATKRWEKENKHSQAACWLALTNKHKSAMDVLMRSEDDTMYMMSSVLVAVQTATSSKSSELSAQCERLLVRLQDPYLRVMLSYLMYRDKDWDWEEVLHEDTLPLRERIAIALQFLEDKQFASYLRRIVDRCTHDGDIEGLIVTGLTPPGLDILQAYVDSTGDVQTSAILSSLSPSIAQDVRFERWLDAYRDLLDGWKLFHFRCQFDIERGRMLQDAVQHMDIPPYDWAPRQILLKCHYCNKPMDRQFPENKIPRPPTCPHCGRPLPRCSVCLMTLTIVSDSARNTALTRSDAQDTLDEALVFCQTCRHGGHASHILMWFYGENSQRSHETCPVAGCSCRCADEG
ncbi:hypothetical protein WOLCODRAFT_126455 [Wolfiporia cocos MD-104 SS10]|uniref:Uncharacterized protein n=1 Tax=Wolfiporia cocos (strain MD-104) TaxID=742152 RepID=A0A2H3J850_WOLCO|nr:hypothetical protein WOLCODRAFT_126455 [Wolfiporia cocos MD-104 SS10]